MASPPEAPIHNRTTGLELEDTIYRQATMAIEDQSGNGGWNASMPSERRALPSMPGAPSLASSHAILDRNQGIWTPAWQSPVLIRDDVSETLNSNSSSFFYAQSHGIESSRGFLSRLLKKVFIRTLEKPSPRRVLLFNT